MDLNERFSLQGKRAVITGGSRGIGAAIAAVLAEAGAEVVVVGRDRAALAEVVDQIEALGRRGRAVEADLETVAGCHAAADAALAFLGTVDILVNNAGISFPTSVLATRVADWDATLAVNLRAPLLLAQRFVPGMIAQRSGKIINVSSQAGVVALADHAAYCASKGGLNMLTKVMAVEWGPYNIQCNAVAPTVILTPMGEKVWGEPAKGDPMKAKIPLGRFGRPVEVADLVLYLAAPASDLITGEVILIDGGYTAI